MDWAKVTADFVIIRAGYGRYLNQKDSMFESHYAGAKSKNIPVGAYWYSYATNEDEARKEADTCIEVLKGKQFEYPIYYDVEESKTLALGREKVSAIMRAFLERMEKAGYWVGIYGSYSSLTKLTDADIRRRYAVWLAHWNVEQSPYNGDYGMWQYGAGKVDGVTGDCDMDNCYVDYPALIRPKGLNGFDTEPDVPEEPDTLEITLTVNGTAYSGRLHKA